MNREKSETPALSLPLSEPTQPLGSSAPRSLNVLVLDEWLPYRPDSGKRVRTWNLLRRLAQHYRISLLCYGEHDSEAASAVQAAGIRLHTVPPLQDVRGWQLYARLSANLFSRYPYSVSKHYTRRFASQLQLLLHEQRYDLVHCEWTPYAQFLKYAGGLPNLVMAHNIESQIWLRRAQNSRTLVERVFFRLQAEKMKWFERETLREAEWVATVTELDAEQARQWGARHVSVVENGVDIDEFTPAEESLNQNELLFLGSLDWYPNVDAVKHLVDEIWPIVQARCPAARLRIVGRRPPAELKGRIAQCAGVELVGEVPDVRPHIARAAVVVVPLRIGGGSRIKILEAMAMGKAVVSTSIGVEGLAVADGVHLLLADTSASFASRTLDLLNSPDLRRHLGENGRKLVEQRYSWDRAADALESAWRQICDLRKPVGIRALQAEGGRQANS